MNPEHIVAPTPPTPSPPYSFPIMATVAPVIVSVALWLLTGSVFALVFAALGPAVAVASLADARLQSRRRLRREGRRFDSELEAARRELREAHDRERARLEATLPSARRLVSVAWSPSELWLARPGPGDPAASGTAAVGDDQALPVGIGSGGRTSCVVLDGMPAASRSRGSAERALRQLEADARSLVRAPVLADASLGIGVVGAPVVAEAVARAVVVQLAAMLSPATHTVVVVASPGSARRWSWIDGLPHDTVIADAEKPDAAHTEIRLAPATGPGIGPLTGAVTVAVAGSRDALPRSARIVIRAAGATAHIEQHPDAAEVGELIVEHLSVEQARTVAASLYESAGRLVTRARASLPDELSFDDCGDRGIARTALDCIVGVTAHGPLALDLAAHGPHAVVGGTTGSGKSELLTAWILAIARAHPPRRASVLLVDFKGGSAFAPLAALPHCVGMITDLDEPGAARALESLAAELRRRERHLAAVGAKSVDDLASQGGPAGGQVAEARGRDTAHTAPLPRLVIVVDEFAAMVAGFPDLHALFADIAARGRSLGVHLILCTQRPAGVIRDAVLANSALRLSLRVNNRADSQVVIGTDAAAALTLHPRGRAYVSTDGDEPLLAQFPLVTPRDIAAVAGRWTADGYRPHRPWLDPLPARITLAQLSLPAGTPADPRDPVLPFGALDDPANQSQPVAVYRPAVDGNLLVVGGAGSGKSSLLAALEASATFNIAGAAPRVERLPCDIESAWDTLVELVAAVRADASPSATGDETRGPALIVLVDDLDVLIGRFSEEYEASVLELVERLLREGPARGIHLVVTTQRLTAALHRIGSLCGSRLLLRVPNRQEHVLAGGDGARFVERSRPGSGHWHGLAVQVALVPEPGHKKHAPHPAALPAYRMLDDSVPLAVVTSRPAEFVARLRSALPGFAMPGAVTDVSAVSGAATHAPAAATAQVPAAAHAAAPAPGLTVSAGRRPSAVVGDVDAWQSQWGALAALRSDHAVVVDGLAAADFRVVTRLRTLPPPLSGLGPAFWLWGVDGSVCRAVLPG